MAGSHNLPAITARVRVAAPATDSWVRLLDASRTHDCLRLLEEPGILLPLGDQPRHEGFAVLRRAELWAVEELGAIGDVVHLAHALQVVAAHQLAAGALVDRA